MIRSAKTLMACRHLRLAAFAVLAALLGACSSQGNQPIPQQPLLPAVPQQVQPQIPNASVAQTADENLTTGPVVYVCDNHGDLWTINLTTLKAHFIAYTGELLTDIGFDPKNHVLYGLSYYSFFKINTTTGAATFIGNLGIGDANALVFDSNGRGYTAGYTETNLYSIDNVATGLASVIGSNGKWESAGDLTFYNNTLVESGYTGVYTGSNKDSLVTLNRTTGAVISVKATNVVNLYGLVSTGTDKLYGFANTSLYKLNPAATTAAGRATLIKDFAATGIGDIDGAAYNGAFQI